MWIILYMIVLAPIAIGLGGVEAWTASRGEVWARGGELFAHGAMTLAAVAGGLSVWNLVERPFKRDR